MIKRSKSVYIIGSIIIGIISVVFIFAGLILTGVIDSSSRKLVFRSGSRSVVYDGQVLTCDEWTFASGELKEGHTVTMTFTGEQLTVGKSENVFTATVFDANGADVTGDYEIEYTFGELAVTARPITITTATESHVYDGVEFRVEEYEYTGELISGDTLVCEFSEASGITDKGIQDNVATATVVNAVNEDVTANYAVELVYGTLEVTPRALVLQSPGEAKPYDGTPLIYECEDPVKELVKGGALVDGHTIVPTFYNQVTTVEEGQKPNDFTAVIMAGERNVTENYSIEYRTSGTLEITPYNTLRIETDSAQKTYDGTPLTLAADAWKFQTNYEKMFTEGSFAGYSMELVFPEITNVNEKTDSNPEKYVIRNVDGEDVSESFKVEVKAGKLEILPLELRITTGSGEKTYDGTPLYVRSWNWENGYNPFTDAEKYPNLSGFAASVEVTGEQLNAWSETYDGNGNVNGYKETGTSKNTAELASVTDENGTVIPVGNFKLVVAEAGTLTVTPRTLKLSSDGVAVQYRGEPWSVNYTLVLDSMGTISSSASVGDWHFFDSNWALNACDGMVPAERLQITFNENFTDVQEGGYLLEKFDLSVIDAKNSVISHGELNYKLDISAFGKVTITPYTVEIETEDYNSEYDGTTQSGTWKFADAAAEQFMAKLGHTLRVNLISARNVCDGQNVFAETKNGALPYSVKAGIVDKTGNYVVSVVNYGTFRITRRTLVVSIDGDIRDYNGEELSVTSWTWVENRLVDGDKLEFYNFPEIVTGKVLNKPEYKLNDGNDGDNYQVVIEYGENNGYLEIIPLKLTIKTVSDEWEYDGLLHGHIDYEDTDLLWEYSGTLAEGQSISAEITDINFVDVDEQENDIEFTILDADGKPLLNVDDCYDLTIDFGMFSIYPREIVIGSESYEQPYNGQELSCEYGYAIGLVEGHEVVFENWATIKDAGSPVKNTFSYYIWDENANDFVDMLNYDISVEVGTLEVTPCEIEFSSLSRTEEYNGKEWSWPYTEIRKQVGSLAAGHSVVFEEWASIKNVEKKDNYFVAHITDENGQKLPDVERRNYRFSCTYGELEVTKRPLFVQTPNEVSKPYDGTPLIYECADPVKELVKGGTLVDGHTIVPTFYNQVTTVSEGRISNRVYVEVVDAEGQSVTENYDIEYEYGVLFILRRYVVIESDSAYKAYDGLPLSASGYVLRSQTGNTANGDAEEVVLYAKGHYVEAPLNRSITAPGHMDNAFDYVAVYNAEGKDVTDCYVINELNGELTILADDVLSSVDTSGSSIGGGSPSEEERKKVVAQIRSSGKGTIYLRLRSEGDYTGTGWSAAALEYSTLIDNTYSANYLTGHALKNALGITSQTLEIELSENIGYILPTYIAMGEEGKEYNYQIQTSDVYQQGPWYNRYEMGYVPFDSYNTGTLTGITAISDEYRAAELRYRTHVKKYYLNVDTSLKSYTYLRNRIAEYDFKPITASSTIEDFNVIFEVANYIRKAALYNYEYNPLLDESGDMIYDFLATYKEGVCRHYASAATMMLRMLGIPARYTVGYRVDNVQAGVYKEVTAGDAHAWVEAYVYGVGWIQFEVTGSSSGDNGDSGNGGGDGGSNPGSGKKMVVTPLPRVELFVGQTITATGYSYSNVPEWLEVGFADGTYVIDESEIVYGGTLSEPGRIKSTIEQFIIRDANGNAIDYTPQFNEGVLQLYVAELTVKSDSANKEYDGTPLTAGASYEGTLLEGHEIFYTFTGSQTVVGEGDNTFSVKIMDGDVDVTGQYKITLIFGSLAVRKAEVTLTVSDNGTVLIIDGALGEGYALSAFPEETDSGYTLDTEQIRVYDANGEDVTENYNFTVV